MLQLQTNLESTLTRITPKNRYASRMDQKIFDQLTPYLGQISFGGIAGFAVGLALRKIGRIALVVFGLLFITLQVLAYAGIVHVDWLRIQNYATPVLEKNALQKTWNDFVGILTNNVPFGAAFIPGLLLGLRFG